MVENYDVNLDHNERTDYRDYIETLSPEEVLAAGKIYLETARTAAVEGKLHTVERCISVAKQCSEFLKLQKFGDYSLDVSESEIMGIYLANHGAELNRLNRKTKKILG